MKFTLNQDGFKQAVMKATAAVGSNTALPIMNNLLIEAEGDTVSITGSDLEQSITTTVPALVFEPGATTMPASKLAKIVSELSAGEITIELEDEKSARIISGRAVFKLFCLPAGSYQKPEDFDADWSYTMPAEELHRIFAKVAYAVSTDGNRNEALTGVLISARENRILSFVATDGRRLALMELPVEEQELPDGDFVVSNKLATEIKFLDKGDVTICVNATYVKVATAETTIVSKLISGNYPNYRQVIPSVFGHEAKVSRQQILNALKRVSLLVQQDKGNSAVRCTLVDSTMTLFAQCAGIGEATEQLDAEYDGEQFNVAFDPQFFSDPLKVLECDQFTMSFTDDLSPVRISGDSGFTYILMPIRN